MTAEPPSAVRISTHQKSTSTKVNGSGNKTLLKTLPFTVDTTETPKGEPLG